MHRACVVTSLLCAVIFGSAAVVTAAAQEQDRSANSLLDPAKPPQLGTLRICLRLPDQTPFLGAASVIVLPEHGYELMGAPDEGKGDMVFYAVAPGKYIVDVRAPAFLPVRLTTEMEPGGRVKALFVVMKPQTSEKQEEKTAVAPERIEPKTETILEAEPESTAGMWTETPTPPTAEIGAETPAEPPKTVTWKPVDWKDDGAVLDPNVTCPTQQVLRSTGARVREFVRSLEKFTATETVEHFPVDKSGERKQPEARTFAYVVSVLQDRRGTFSLEEFRNGGEDRAQFPANIATIGLPAVVLVFHPDYAPDFDFACDGLIHAQGHDYWQMRFAQREDRPVRIESYVVNNAAYGVYLQGRAWIDPGKSQVVRLESQLLKPISQIELWQQHQVIDYTGVKFAATGQEIWLPQVAEVYVERHGRRFYRRHSFRDFLLFNVDTTQSVKAPKGSYSFTNLTDRDMTGELTVNPIEDLKGGPIILRFQVPAHRTVIKTVGPGKDVNLPPAAVASAKFVHSGETGSVKVDVDLVKETTLDVVPETVVANP